MNTCKCGIAAVDCDYHRTHPSPMPTIEGIAPDADHQRLLATVRWTDVDMEDE